VNLFARQWSGEMIKMFARKRTHLGYIAFLGVELVILGFLHRPHPQKMLRKLLEENGYLFEEYFSGFTVAFVMLKFTVFLLGGLYLALVAGDIVAKESEDGTLRMILSRPVSRSRVLMVKYLSVIFYTFTLMGFITATSILGGLLYRGWGGLFVWDPGQNLFGIFSGGEAVQRFVLAAWVLSAGTATITSLGFMFSCFNIKPAAATIATLSVFLLDLVLQLIPYFESIKPSLLTVNIAVWQDVFQDPIPWWRIGISLLYLFAFSASFFIVGAVQFHLRDFKS
jgi:ABC-2 type transport system permease protein